MVLIPLGLHASRGDQIENARRLATSGAAVVIEGEEITKEYFVSVVKNLVLLDSKRRGMLEAARAFQMSGADRKIAETVIQLARRKSGRRREAHG
jgi:UDP-N-acetylglucosamine:LPS N-acetylglucosamine transferase